MQPWILDLLSTCAEIERLLQLLTDFPGELWSYKKKGIAVMIKDVSRCRHHSRGIFHFSSNCWNLEKQICHYISEPRGVWLCNNNVPLVFLCSMSIKKTNSHIRQKENMLWNIERRRHSINDALPVWLRNEQFFSQKQHFWLWLLPKKDVMIQAGPSI